METEVSRNQYQEFAMTIIYDCLTLVNMGETFDIKEVISGVVGLEYDECDIFVKEVTIKSMSHLKEIIEAYEPFMRKWKFDRLSRLCQAILVLAYSEYYYVGGIDKKIVIDVAIKLSKKYLEETDFKFVNGILDNVLC